MWPGVDFVLGFFLAGWSAVEDPPVGRFLGLDNPETEPEAVVDVVRGVEFFAECLGGL
jgi:hypothetical protein